MSDRKFNIRHFYKVQVAQEESEFEHRTGLKIRHSFQPWNGGTDIDEVFAVKTYSGKECIGIETEGVIFYLVPENNQQAILLFFDSNFLSIILELSQWTDAKLSVFMKHVPSLMNAVNNGVVGNFNEYCVFVDEDMVCFAKRVNIALFGDISSSSPADYDLMPELLDLIHYRTKCFEELASFEGFSAKEQREILFKTGLSATKKGLRYVRLANFISTIN